MKALCWHGSKDIRCDEIPEPEIEHPRDAIVKVTTAQSVAQIFISMTATCREWRAAT
jgi:hypothetical protein